jgi:hypothetical protein
VSSARGLAAALVGFALVGPIPARAQSSEPVALQWNAPAGCSGAHDVLGRVRKLTQSTQFADRQLRAEATITPADRGRLHLELVLHAGNLVGARSIDGQSCEDLAGATAVVLALLLKSAEPLNGGDLSGSEPFDRDPRSGAQSEAGSRDGDERTRTPASAPVGDDTKPEPTPPQDDGDDTRAQRRFRGVLQLPRVSLEFGALPGPSIGFSLAGGIVFDHWTLLAEGGTWLKQTLKAHDQPGAGAKVQRIEAALRGCRAIPFGQFELAPCLRVSLQHTWARGAGAHIAARTAEASWVAAGVGVQARYHFLQWFSVVAGIDAQLETARPRLAIGGVGNLGQLGPAAFTITLGSEWIL